MNKFLTLLLLATFFTACGGPQTAQDTTEEVAATTTEEPVAVNAEADEAAPAYITTVLQADLPSPRKEMVAKLGEATITINYGSPSVKGREIWGALVPYDEVWRTGANEATTFTTDTELEVGDQILPAGTYGLFTIPSQEQWIIIFNETAEQWGAYEYDQNKDIIRVKASPKMSADYSESLEFIVENDTLMFAWGNLRLPFPLG
ncbi:MAG: DUF2911 domain-containing protein [Bacteroidetes bacterium]|nr:MAG: DUF2911 domain-containing protein [Bacteroidota bacterium]